MGGAEEGIRRVNRRGAWVPQRLEQPLDQEERKQTRPSQKSPSQRGYETGSARSKGRRTRR